MLRKNIKKQNGFTLVETIVVIFIFTLLAMGVTTLFTHIFISSRDRVASLDNIDQARLATTKFTNEIRTASVANDGSAALTQAGDSQIIFYSDYGQTSGIMARNRYFLSTSTLYKGVTVPTGSPLSYNLGAEKIITVQNNISSSTTPIFYYYDGNYNGSSTALNQPININDVKYVKMSLNILKMTERNATTIFNVNAGASIRNLKDNLGN